MKEKLVTILVLLMCSVLLGACGTLDVGIEGTAVPVDQADPTDAALATENAHLSAEVTRLAEAADATPFPLAWTTIVTSSRELQGEPPEGCEQVGWNVWRCLGELGGTQTITMTPTTIVAGTVEHVASPNHAGTVTVIGTLASFHSATAAVIPDSETPFADTNGVVKVQITEWARIRNSDGSVAAREHLSKGARLEVMASLQDETLVADEVVILSPGVPPPGENPAYTDVTGLVTPLAEPPPSGEGAIRLFEASSDYPIVDPGASVTLRWASEGEAGTICERITPRPLSDTCYIDLPSSGSLEVAVPAEARGAIGYFLYVQAEERVEEALVILPLTAERGCDYDWFFGNPDYKYKPLLECPTSAPVEIRPQAQVYEKGLMLRLEDVSFGEDAWLVTLVHQSDGSYSLGFEPVVDSWSLGMPETDPTLVPPDGFYQPSRGFGLLWRGEIEHPTLGEPQILNGVDVLGWAIGSVFEYDAVYQCFQGTHGRGLACFMSGPDGAVLPMPVNR